MYLHVKVAWYPLEATFYPARSEIQDPINTAL